MTVERGVRLMAGAWCCCRWRLRISFRSTGFG